MPRILYAMASDGLLFRCLSVVNDRFKTPIAATFTTGTLAGKTPPRQGWSHCHYRYHYVKN